MIPKATSEIKITVSLFEAGLKCLTKCFLLSLGESGSGNAKSKATPQMSSDKGDTIFHVIDPLYKGVVLRQSGHYVVGVVGLKEPHEGDGIVAQMLKHLPAR